jgi:hypothetical protein
MTAFYDALQFFFIPWRRKKMREEIQDDHQGHALSSAPEKMRPASPPHKRKTTPKRAS